jgi:hypothetical protein
MKGMHNDEILNPPHIYKNFIGGLWGGGGGGVKGG